LLSEEEIKKEMTNAFKKLKLDMYTDILRIKKPQPHVLLAGSLLCRLVSSFRGGSHKQTSDSFSDWTVV